MSYHSLLFVTYFWLKNAVHKSRGLLLWFGWRSNCQYVFCLYSCSLPSPKLPAMEYVPHVILEGFISAVVSFTITLSSAKILARKDGDVISPSQELIAVGSSNLLGSFFSCFVSAAPIGRSVINQSLGSKSQLSSLFGCIFMITLFLTCGQALTYLPTVRLCFLNNFVRYYRSIDWLIDWTIDWLIDWLIDRSIDWLIDSSNTMRQIHLKMYWK